ncbi:MAG: HEAT repeat domain-containing protein [Gemmatimonadota bacterium]
MMSPLRDSRSADRFDRHFGRLVVLLRLEPANISGQKDALRCAMALLEGPVLLEAGIEYSDVPDEGSFKGRLLYRRVDSIVVDEDARPAEVLVLARALASDTLPVENSPSIQVELLPVSAVRSDLHGASSTAPVIPEPVAFRPRTISGPVEDSEMMLKALDQSLGQGHWMEALHAAQSLVRLTPRYPEHERRGYLIQLRRIFHRKMLENFIDFAMRSTEEQPRLAEVLHFAGPEAVELMVDHICQAESIGPRRFLHEVLASIPESLPLLLPRLDSPRWYEARHAVELIGRLGQTDTIPVLVKALEYSDARVRQAAVIALARFDTPAVLIPIRRALLDQAPGTRASAAYALADRHSPALAMPILAVLEGEKDLGAWTALVTALVRIDSAEALKSLLALALDHHAILKSARPIAQRVAIVEALAASGSAGARGALERLVNEGEGALRRAAQEAAGRLGERGNGK